MRNLATDCFYLAILPVQANMSNSEPILPHSQIVIFYHHVHYHAEADYEII